MSPQTIVPRIIKRTLTQSATLPILTTIMCSVTVLQTNVWAQAGKPVGNPMVLPLDPDATIESNIQKNITAALDDSRITVKVFTVGNDRFARLTGTVKDTIEGEAAVETAAKFVTIEHVISSLLTDPNALKLGEKPSSPGSPNPKYTDTWQLRLLGTTLTDLDGNEIAADDLTKADAIKTVLNNIYKASNDTKDPVDIARGKLVLYGNAHDLVLMKRDLVQLDAAGPQVQLDAYAIQISGQGDKFTDSINQINTKLVDARASVKFIQSLFQRSVSNAFDVPAGPSDKGMRQGLLDKLKIVGMDPNPHRLMSFTETLIFLSVLDLDGRKRVFDSMKNYKMEKYSCDLPGVEELYVHSGAAKGVPSAEASIVDDARQTFVTFLDTLMVYQHLDRNIAGVSGDALRYDQLFTCPEGFSRQADIFDNLHARVAEAYAADLKTDVISPLLKDISGLLPQNGRGKGVSLLGQTRLVVTSGMQTSLKPTLQSAVDVSEPTPFSLNDAKDLKEAAAAVISGLSGTQAFALGALLNQEPKTFATIATGVGVSVRPTVYPNATAARLQIDANFGVDAVLPAKADGSTNPQPPVLDAVKSHVVKTDVNIDALDLFGISSLNIDTQIPKGPFVFPVLGRLPLIGPAFQFPRKDAKVRQYSVILVNTVILPRALDVTHYYGG